VFVDRGVVHEHNDVLMLGPLVDSKLCQQPVQEVVEYYRIGPSFRDLRCHYTVLSQSCYHGE
jgi:hypothetical protein